MYPISSCKLYGSARISSGRNTARQQLKALTASVSSPSKCLKICQHGYYLPALPSRRVVSFATSNSGRNSEPEQELHKSKQIALLAVVPVALISLKWVVSTGFPAMVVPALLLAVPIAGSGIRDLLVEGLQMALKGWAWSRSHQPHPSSSSHQQGSSFPPRQDHVNSWSRQPSVTSPYEVTQQTGAYHYDAVQMSPNDGRRSGVAASERSSGRHPGAFSSPAELIAYHKARAAVEQQQQQVQSHRPGSPVARSWSQPSGSSMQPAVSTAILQRPASNQQGQPQKQVHSQPFMQQQQQQHLTRPASPEHQQVHMQSMQQNTPHQNMTRQQSYHSQQAQVQQQQYPQAQNNVSPAPTRGRSTPIGSTNSNCSPLSSFQGEDMDWPATLEAEHVSQGHGPRQIQGRMQDNHPERYAAT